MSVVVSIDFDYFVRDIDFDYNRFSESDMDRFADFPPKDIGRILREKGLDLDQRTEIARASEHNKGYNFLKDKVIKLLVNFDAHHDVSDYDDYGNFPAEFVSEGNWLRFLNPEIIYMVYPKRCKRELNFQEEFPELNARIMTVDDLPRFDLHVDYLFVCRSAYWMPYSKHLDEFFQEMLSVLLEECGKKIFNEF